MSESSEPRSWAVDLVKDNITGKFEQGDVFPIVDNIGRRKIWVEIDSLEELSKPGSIAVLRLMVHEVAEPEQPEEKASEDAEATA